MELTTICVFIVIWIILCVVTNIIAFFFNWTDDNDGFFLSLIFTCLGLSAAVTYILLEKGVI